MFSRDTLRRLWPRAKPELINGIADAAPTVFAKYGCGDIGVVAIIMGQFSHECGAGLEMTENIAYSASRACAVWPSRFTDAADCYRKVGSYPGDPSFRTKLIDSVYGGRMGNRPGTHDGSLYIGRGPSQITGHDGYAAVSAKVGLDLLGHPELATDPVTTLECAVADFVICGCLPFAKAGDIRGTTRKLNGGYIGLSERQQWTKRWQVALAAEQGATVSEIVPAPQPRPSGTLQQGDKGYEVKAIQQQLAAKGYACGADDGEFHEATRDAVLAMQANEGLPTTGMVDQATKDALSIASDKPMAEGRVSATIDDLRAKGSGTVANADSSSLVAKIAGGSAIVTGADKAGVLDKVKELTDQADSVKSVIDPLQGIIQWLTENWWIGALVACAAVIYFNRGVIAARLADHRSGANLGR